MAMRLARPTRLVDIARIPGLAYIRDDGDAMTIGATTKQCVVETDALVRAKLPLLHRAMPHVGHGATRARGTVGGSLANGDPAAEIALVAITIGATLNWREAGRISTVAAAEFFLGPMVTALPVAACLESVRFPVWSEPRLGTSFHEVNARQSDFAFVSAAAQIAIDGDDRCTRVALGIGAAAATPLRLDVAALEGTRAEEAKVRDAIIGALANIETLADLHASAEYRRRVAQTLAIRAIADAYRDAHAR